MKISGLERYLLLASDLATQDAVNFALVEREDYDVFSTFLREIKREIAYAPRVIVTDLDPAWFKAIRHVYPTIPIQGCVVHMERIIDRLMPKRNRTVKQEELKVFIRRFLYASSLADACEIRASYREIKSHFKRSDARIRRRIYAKYGVRERNRVQQILHNASAKIVRDAKRNGSAIIMEKLTGIRSLYAKSNGQGRGYRARMNAWSYAELQRQINYKARWEGLPVIYVKPRGTSIRCSLCGSRMTRKPEENRELKCVSCGLTLDRDVNAARNILARGMRFVPDAPAVEAMVQERGVHAFPDPESRCR